MSDSKTKEAAIKTAKALTNYETLQHIENVQHFIHVMVIDLLLRGENHDKSKMSPEEIDLFVDYTPKLKGCTYNSEEYKGFLKALQPALDHHYANNSHHPEHFKNGISDMTLVDLLEAFCDWKAASMRHHDGNLLKSIEINAARFEMSTQLRQIFENTAKKYDGK